MLISTALLLDSNIRNSVCTPAKLPCRRVEVRYEMFIEIIFCVSFMSVSIKVKMSDSDEDPEIISGLTKGGFNVTNCSNGYLHFHFNKSLPCIIRISFIHGL
jgi:hypothetical protein